VPGFTPSALSAFGVAAGQTSPLVLDFDGDGAELTDHDGAIEDILFTWAGVDGIATDSRGPYIDARRREFLKECFDAEWQQYGYLPDPEVNAAAQLEVSWDIVFTAMKAALLLQSGADELYGGDGDDLIYGGAANPVQNDILDGGHGNDTLHGYRSDDTLTGGTGGNFLYGGMGDDTYIYAGGSDVLAEEGSGGTDILELPDGIELADLDLYRIQTGSSTTTYNDLLIRIDGGGSIQIGQQSRTDTGYQVETLVFHDTSTLDLLDLDIDTLLTEGDDYLAVTLSTADADDVVYGLSGDDSIRTFSGNDILDGGTGNDILQGDDGHDTYIASPG
jgi:Ca2+-binding RTX toxin-like protein